MALAVCLGWFLLLPLRDILAFPDRVAVLPNLETDAAAYDAFARDFAASWEIAALPSKHPPGWMVMLGGVYALVGHSYVAGKMLSWLALVITVALCAWLAHRVFGRTAAIVAALLCASSPGLRGYVGTLQYEVVTGALFMLLLVLSVKAADAHTRGRALRAAALAGAAGAALVLTRETFVLVVPLAAVWLWRQLQARIDPRSSLLAALVVVGVAAAPALVWSAVQTLHYERLILISEKGLKEFQLGNNPLANGTYNEPLVGMAEPAGFAYIRSEPLGALRLAGRKVLYSFGVIRDGWNVPHPMTIWIWRATTGAVPLRVIEPIAGGGWLLVSFVAGLVVLRRSGWRRWWVLPATIAAILAVHVITLASFRFTVPLLPALYVVASGALAAKIPGAVAVLRAPAAAVGVATILVLAVAAQFRSWPLDAVYRAAALDGLSVANGVDPVSGSEIRIAEARGGARPVALLADTYLPQGTLTVTVRMRQTALPASERDVARIALVARDGTPGCAVDVPASHLPPDRFVDVPTSCHLAEDGPATLAVYTLGESDLAIETVRLTWTR